jgi:hypothetical protein
VADKVITEYIVLGVLLILMGAVQTWLRHGPWSRETDGEQGDEEPRRVEVGSGGRLRSGRRWESWTAIMGGVGIILGIVLVVMGVTGS